MSHLQAGDSRAADAHALSSPNKVSVRENSHYFLKHLLGNIEIYNSLWELSYILRLPGDFTRARHDVKLPALKLSRSAVWTLRPSHENQIPSLY